MKNGKLSLGFIGCGGIAFSKFFPTLARMDSVCSLDAFCNHNIAKAELAKAQFGSGDARTFSDYHDMLAMDELDIIYVLTPNSLHAEMTCAALGAGKHVFCEKPMAISSAEGEQMIAAATVHKKKLMISYQSRFRDDAQLLKSACEDGMLGDIYYARAHAIRRREVPTWGVFTDAKLQGGGPLIDIGSHALDLTLWLMGNFEPASVSGSVYYKMAEATDGNRFGPWNPAEFQVEDSAFGFIRMQNGATVYLETSWALNSTDVREAMSSLSGTKGGAEMYRDAGGKPQLVMNTARYGHLLNITPQTLGSIAPFGQQAESAVQREAIAFLRAIAHDEPVPVHPREALQVTRILEAIYQSAQENRTVLLG